MIKNILFGAVFISILGFWVTQLYAHFTPMQNHKLQGPVVVELFTSQSCSSCPPADRNLAALSDNPNIITLGFHVTYWNHLHWKDTLSHQFSTDRQRAYAAYTRGGRVYTPQMVVNGADEFVGSRKGDINRAIANTHNIQPITLNKNNDNSLSADLPDLPPGSYTLWLAGTQNEHTQAIPTGENRGRTVTYKNAVIDFTEQGSWNGKAGKRTFNIEANPDVDRYVLLVQQNGFGKITAAGQI